METGICSKLSAEAERLYQLQQTFLHVLADRYPSDEMKTLWSGNATILRWRNMWIEIARGQMQLDVKRITQSIIDEMESVKHIIDYELAKKEEKKRKHDTMGHLHAFIALCPSAADITHLGCTTCEITDNSELIAIRDSLRIIAIRLARCIKHLKTFALQWKDQPTLGFTHFQPAQPTTVGKRACMWMQDLLMDLMEVERLLDMLRFRGIKGTTGTEASFLELFGGDHGKVRALDRIVTEVFGFKKSFIITGQTYTRKQDAMVLARLASLGASAHKMCTDIRLLSNRMEIEEPHEKDQDGSSAMPFKQNPMLDERGCALARYLMNLFPNANETHAVQWLERTLDDSAIRRMILPEAFLTTDAILMLLQKIIQGLEVFPKMMERNMEFPLPFLASEEIIMHVVKAGGSRQTAHEKIKYHSKDATRRFKVEGGDNNFFELIAADPYFGPVHGILGSFLDASRYIGRAPQQVEEFVTEEVDPVLAKYDGQLDGTVVINV